MDRKKKKNASEKKIGIGKTKMMTKISFLSFEVYFLFSARLIFMIFVKIVNKNIIENKKPISKDKNDIFVIIFFFPMPIFFSDAFFFFF